MRTKLLDWIKKEHDGQIIRNTNKPYIDHLLFVAQKAGAVTAMGYEIGLCHDLLEETSVTANKLHQNLLGFGYAELQAVHITNCVVELTDVFTKKAFPDIRKKERKKREAARLAGISPDAQTVKYADMIYNINWMMTYEIDKANKYLHKKQQLIKSMTCGNAGLRLETLELVSRCFTKIGTKIDTK